ncbi:hypothetical protein [Pontibacillus salipaludis]|uniref:Uncharacterized protein n=1 Tax=Pontibacillus salipaludis TaxID=1697394 RepID=A0ABQ1Q4R9_9BACI|nr:hypothetical protein [Pontibacillus salipaludis]GGD13885.1 hypothetical protein GCM10011389_21920 [Pontibacillus salipaludis]
MDILERVLLTAIVVAVFISVNSLANYYARRNFKKRLWAGMLFIFSTPLFMFGLSMGVKFINEGDEIAGTIGLLASIPYFINGLVVFFSAFRLVKPSEIVGSEKS